MADFTIYCDDLQEGIWFQELDPHFENAELEVIPSKKAEIMSCGLDEVLKYDRPDIILKDENNVIFVLERTVEVPSGHNVGQRYGRLLAAAEANIPIVSAKYCYITHELRLHQNDRCKRFTPV